MAKRDRAARDSAARPRQDDPWSGITEAALAVEGELRKFEQLSLAARRMPIDTHRQLERAARATMEAAEGQARVKAALDALVQTIQALRERHERNLLALGERSEAIGQRASEITPLYERYAALGDESRLLNEAVKESAALAQGAKTPEQIGAFAATLEGIEGRMAKLGEDARELAREAAAAGATDLVEQAEALRQRVAAVKNKLAMLRRGLQAS